MVGFLIAFDGESRRGAHCIYPQLGEAELPGL